MIADAVVAAIANAMINKNTTLGKILEIKGSEKVLTKHKVPCVSCPMAKFEMEKLKIGEICKMYGLPLKDILKDLN